MKKFVVFIVAALLLGVVGRAFAQEDRTEPYLKVICITPSAHVTLEPLGPEGGQLLILDGKPVKLKKGEEYLVAVTKPGYEPYRKRFKAEWVGARETNVKLERGIGPTEDEIWMADLEDSVVMKFVPIPAGYFMMGSYEGDQNERPVRRVVFERPFWMAMTEVTNQQFEQYQEHLDLYKSVAVQQQSLEQRKKLEKNELPMPQGANYPQAYVTWGEAVGFCKWLTKKDQRRGRIPEGYEYALPTEAEWEYACRAGTTTEYAGRPETMAWFMKNSSGKTSPVGQKKPNAWGLYDMHGNLWEWCSDIWYASYFNAPEDGSHRGDLIGEYDVDRTLIEDADNIHRLLNNQFYVVRGGAWNTPASSCRSSNRFYQPLKDHDNTNYNINCLGFRPVLVWMEPEVKLKSTKQLDAPAR